MFPVRYELNSYINFLTNLVFKGLTNTLVRIFIENFIGAYLKIIL
jgi:hypothetical protein